ncbi:PREDICTED: transcription elongation factor, mitochondrial-like isoform X2 [Trachymyrmex cornetzi]|uniref:transcription elongation factor, mitochondrial-like isoform X2 n=1 Tax=Trachymyrmex cornetzi TaxID=471704 RepID=UPI00084F6E89|nr:PREDICTED: transcription elongation factor, mitochondrial-like isoform X2 [Trachymyrmex cornetzi]
MWNRMLTRFFSTIIKTQRVQRKDWTLSATAIFKTSMCTDTFDMNLLSPEDKKKILQIINNKTTEDLLQYSITKKRAQTLESYRENNGPFESLDDLLQVQNMNNRWIYNFYKSIIYGKKRKKPKKIMSGLVITPRSTENNHKNINTVLGIYIGHDIISWSLLNRNCEVLQWSYKSFPQKGKKEDILSLLQTTLPIAKELPKADRYIMQETGGDTGHIKNTKFYQNFIQRYIIGAIILSHLTIDSKFNDTTEFVANNICILRQCVLRKIYELVVDNETISTQYMVQKLLQESDELIKTKEPKVLIGTELRNMYNTQSSICQEQIGWSLLIALAFVELVLHKRTDMVLREASKKL